VTRFQKFHRFFSVAILLLSFPAIAQQTRQALSGHVPKIVSNLTPVDRLTPARHLDLAIGLPLRNQAELENFLKEVSDPASPNYRHYLTPEQFAEQFGPTEQDYQAVENFFRANGFAITTESPNRVLLDVNASVSDIERVFHVALRTYQHPTENRIFFAPDIEPSIDLSTRILDVSGLSDYPRPYPKFVRSNAGQTFGLTSKFGSGPQNTYIGNDFRATYAPGVSLTGAGQTVALVQFDGYYLKDMTNYENLIGISLANYVPLTNVLIDGFSGNPVTPITPNSGSVEVSLDIEMVISMAPGISRLILYEGNPANFIPNDVLNSIANDSFAKQISSSWGWSGGPDATTEQIFKQMIAQGQTYFNASGDSDAFLPGELDNPSSITQPSASTNITQVGGTTLLSTNPVSEQVWNYGGGGGSGGISISNVIPAWQTGIDMTANHGSTTFRNVPDVALTGDNVYVLYGNGTTNGTFGGTSCAAPLWAGFTALVNQRTAQLAQSPVGFINPAIYEIGKESTYASIFHDVVNGNNFKSSSPTNFPAVTGFDLCTGWGSPAGSNLINALVSPDPLVVSPAGGFISSGRFQGPFNVTALNISLTNKSGTLNWSLINTSAWLNASLSSGALTAGGAAANVTVSLNTTANNLAVGFYTSTLWFSNQTSHVAHGRVFTLRVDDWLVVSPGSGFVTTGPAGGPFNLTNQIFILSNASSSSINWFETETSSWFNVPQNHGTLTAGAFTNLSVSLNANANILPVGVYLPNMIFTNQTTGFTQARQFTLQVGQSLVQNGGFETGDFTGWTLTESGGIYSFVDDGSVTGISPHRGTFLAALGQPTATGTLSQSLPTLPGQIYFLSLWFNSPNAAQASGGLVSGNTPNTFSVSWGGTTLFNQSNIPILGWTNMQFIVTAIGTNTVLQFGERVDPWYFGLDDVSVQPIPLPSFRTAFKTNNAIGFTFNSLAGLQYVVQFSTNLSKTNWFVLNTNTATGFTMTVTNAIGTNQLRFYRIRRLP